MKIKKLIVRKIEDLKAEKKFAEQALKRHLEFTEKLTKSGFRSEKLNEHSANIEASINSMAQEIQSWESELKKL